MKLHPLAITLLLPIQASSSSKPFSSLSNFKVEESTDTLVAKNKKRGFFNFEINDLEEESYEIDETIVDEVLPEEQEEEDVELQEEEEDIVPVKKSIWGRKKILDDAPDEEMKEEEEVEEGDDDSDDIVQDILQEESMIESEAENEESTKEPKTSWFGIRNIVEEQVDVENTAVDAIEAEEEEGEEQYVQVPKEETSSWFGGKKSVEAEKEPKEEEFLDTQEEDNESTTVEEDIIDEEETKISKSEERKLKKEELRKQKAQEKQQKLEEKQKKIEEKKKAIEEKKQKIQDLKKEREAKRVEKEAVKKVAKDSKLEKSKQKEEKEVDGKKEEKENESSKSDTPQNAKPPMPPMMENALSPGPLLIIPPPTMSRNPRQFGSPGGPPTSADATMAILSVIVPLISRLVVLTLCSSIFGLGDHIYTPEPSQHFMFEKINHRYQKDSIAMAKALESPPPEQVTNKWLWALTKGKRKNSLKQEVAVDAPKNVEEMYKRTVIVMNVDTYSRDISSVVDELRDAVSFILSQYHDKKQRIEMGDELEVVVCLESPGGVVQEFGLAANQLERLTHAGYGRNDVSLTVCVDKIAASGGYMIACQASPGKLLAAPFAVVGSIGVLRETINVHDVLNKYGVKPYLLTAGEAKVPLTQIGAVTEEGLGIVQKQLDEVHHAFKYMVHRRRGAAINEKNFAKVTNGDIFLGLEGKKCGLVDEIMTSDDYINERVQAGDRVLRLHKYDRSKRGIHLSPLDILLLRSQGLLGKKMSARLRQVGAAGQQVFKVLVSLGMMKAVDTGINFTTRRRRPEDDI
ncbi:hypothetical protein CTEN210_12132 [Chaetoceros tenuissimus]|uniref:Peptidase S49 domain-containing protein n=1 Tax=Chaetoceros tenuissimus TaxID=426638 RepID=A0AAD3D2M3_9STRA|nr:hypothetical protein CTEN210_12132 [Chaetoceros tenuissimus]